MRGYAVGEGCGAALTQLFATGGWEMESAPGARQPLRPHPVFFSSTYASPSVRLSPERMHLHHVLLPPGRVPRLGSGSIRDLPCRLRIIPVSTATVLSDPRAPLAIPQDPSRGPFSTQGLGPGNTYSVCT